MTTAKDKAHWKPTTSEARLDRLESLEAIRQLPHRYAQFLDSRNIEELVKLFPVDVRVGKEKFGREELVKWFSTTMSKPKVSIHFVANHTIDMQDADHASGIVYCHDQLEQRNGEWHTGFLQYWDSYERHDGQWQFRHRKFHRWYMVDALTRPTPYAGNDDRSLTTHPLPDAYPSWARFWKEQAPKA